MAKAAEELSSKDLATEGVPDAFKPLAEGFQANWRTIVYAASGLLVALLLGAVWLEMQSRHRDAAAQATGDVLTLVDDQVVSDPDADAAEAKPGAKPDTKAKPAKPDSEEFSSEREKQEAILKKAQAAAEANGSQPAGRVALLTLGDAQFRLGKYQEAVDTFQKFDGEVADTNYLKAFGELGKADALLALGKKDEALAAARELADHPPGGFGRDLGLLAQGRVAEQTGQIEAAKQAYKLLRNEAPDSATGRAASDRLTLLGEPPPPPSVGEGAQPLP